MRNALSVEFSSGNVYFEKFQFTMLLEDRFYLMPVLPDSYEFSKAQIDSLGTMILEYTDANNNYFGVSLSLNKDKVSYKTTETFVKLDGKEVQMAIYLPESGTGVYSWEEETYPCYVNFSKESMSTRRSFVNDLCMEKIMIL